METETDMDYSPSPSPTDGNSNYICTQYSLGGVLSWCLLLITGWLTFSEPNIKTKWADHRYYKGILFWLYPTFITTDGVYYALYMFYLIFFPIIILSLLIFIAGFGVYIYCLFIKKDYNVINSLFGRFTKFHFVPFLCASALFMISELTNDHRTTIKISKFQIFLTIVISFVGLVSISFIYLNTKLEYPMYARLTINRGTFSCLLALFSFGFFYNIFYLGYLDRYKDKEILPQDEFQVLKNWVRGCNYAFSIIFGAVNLGLSTFFRDIVLAGINGLMYIGMAINFFLIDDWIIRDYFDDKRIVGVIDIVMALASAGLAIFLFYKFNPFIHNNNNE